MINVSFGRKDHSSKWIDLRNLDMTFLSRKGNTIMPKGGGFGTLCLYRYLQHWSSWSNLRQNDDEDTYFRQ